MCAALALDATAKRRCPICDLRTDANLCPEHKISTLLVNIPDLSSHQVDVGTIVGGRYIIEEKIGKGGFGAVYAARHTGTGRLVAIKCLASGRAQDELSLRRFFREAQVTSGLAHPNTIRVFDFGQDDSGLLFIAMELLEGNTLKAELRKRRKEGRLFSEAEALKIGIDVTRSLAEAHAAGLVHRDLKPDNIFLHQVPGDDPVVKVLDFGIVKYIDSNLTLGSDSGVPGTPAYMSPEQVSRGEVDGRSDLYALGVILYQLVAGQVPLRGDNVMQTLYMHVHEEPRRLSEVMQVPVSSRFIAIVHQVLSKRREDRPQSAVQLRDMLEQCLETSRSGEFSGPPPTTVMPFSSSEMAPRSVREPVLEPTAELSGPSVSLFSNPAIVSPPLQETSTRRFSARAVLWAVGLFVLSGIAVGVLASQWMSSEEAAVLPSSPPKQEELDEPGEPGAQGELLGLEQSQPRELDKPTRAAQPDPLFDPGALDQPEEPVKPKVTPPRRTRPSKPKPRRRKQSKTAPPPPQYDILDEKI